MEPPEIQEDLVVQDSKVSSLDQTNNRPADDWIRGNENISIFTDKLPYY